MDYESPRDQTADCRLCETLRRDVKRNYFGSVTELVARTTGGQELDPTGSHFRPYLKLKQPVILLSPTLFSITLSGRQLEIADLEVMLFHLTSKRGRTNDCLYLFDK